MTRTLVSGPTAGVVGQSAPFTAVAYRSDYSQSDVTSSNQWSSSNSGVAAVSTGSLVTAMAAGTAVIGAVF